MTEEKSTYVITCGDEGVQINEGVRLAFAGSGYELPSFSKAVSALKKVFGKQISIVACAENNWIKDKMDLSDFEQADASMQQQIEALADQEGLSYAGFIPFSDPKKLKDGVKGHMVRPKKIHVANKICFTLGGGEQIYNLGCYKISADWVHASTPKVAKEVIEAQIEFYNKLAKKDLPLFYEADGELGEKIVKKNLKVLEKMGLKLEALPER
jgi:hypothetical protein